MSQNCPPFNKEFRYVILDEECNRISFLPSRIPKLVELALSKKIKVPSIINQNEPKKNTLKVLNRSFGEAQDKN